MVDEVEAELAAARRGATSLWPVQGLQLFLAHPGLWLRPLLGSFLSWSLMVIAFTIGVVFAWPAEEVAAAADPGPATGEEADPGVWGTVYGWFGDVIGWLYEVSFALGIGLAAGLLIWVIVTPLIMSFAYEHLVKAVFKRHGIAAPGETTWKSVTSAFHATVRTLGWRIFWPIASVVCLIPPFTLISPLVSQVGLAHISMIDGCDLALSLRGIDGKARARWLQQQRRTLWFGVIAGACIGAILGLTFVAWLLFMPMMFTGTALLVANWEPPPAEDEPTG